MDFYSMEQFEIMADAMEEVSEWEAYKADMAEQSVESPSDADMAEMARYYGE